VQARAKNGLRELAFVVLLSAARRAASYAYTAFGESCLGRKGQGPSSAGRKSRDLVTRSNPKLVAMKRGSEYW